MKGVYEGLGKNFSEYEFSVIAKYESWKENDWKDGHGNKIKNWKTKFKNQIPFLKPIYTNGNTAKNRNERNIQGRKELAAEVVATLHGENVNANQKVGTKPSNHVKSGGHSWDA